MTLKEYFNNLSHARRGGYASFYSAAADAMGGIGIGFLAPFKAWLSKLNHNSPLIHKINKGESKFYRGLNRYIKLINMVNQEILMRPIANIAGLVGGALGFGVGLFTSIIPQTHSAKAQKGTAYHVTDTAGKLPSEGNEYFGNILVAPRSERRWGAFVWAGLAGMEIGSYYAAPVVILGNTIQGAAGFGNLFAITAATLIDLPHILKDLFKAAKTVYNFLDKSIGFILRNAWKALKWVGTQIKNVLDFGWKQVKSLGTKLVNAVKEAAKLVRTACSKVASLISNSVTFVVDQVKFVYNKIAKVCRVIKEQGLRGLIAWVKDKTIGAVLRYMSKLTAVHQETSDLRSLVNKQEKAAVGSVNAILTSIGLTPSADLLQNIDTLMKRVELVAEAHRKDYTHGGVDVKLEYLRSLKDAMEAFNSVDAASVSKIAALLDVNYRTWNAPKAPQPPVNAAPQAPAAGNASGAQNKDVPPPPPYGAPSPVIFRQQQAPANDAAAPEPVVPSTAPRLSLTPSRAVSS